LAVNYLTGGEYVTAAKLNELWAEVDAIASKALDNKSSLLVLDYTDRELFGQPFLFFTPSKHGIGDLTTFSGVFGEQTGQLSYDWEVVLSPHNQSAKDAAANSAVVSYVDNDKFIAYTAETLNLEASLKAHTRTTDGDEFYLSELSKKHPEKIWNTAVAEIIIGNHSGSFVFSDTWQKWNCFRVHNLTMSSVSIIFGDPDAPTHSFTLEANSQRCVRRDSVTSGYDSTHRYVWNVKAGDPRFLKFTSHAGSVAQTMEANNVSNPSWLYRFFDKLEEFQLISLDRDTFTDVGASYQSAGYLPEVTDNTLVADLVYHKGDLCKVQNGVASTITFDGFGTFPAALSAAGFTSDATGAKFQIDKDSSSILLPVTTNLLTKHDTTRSLDMTSNDQTLETSLLLPTGSTFGSWRLSGYQRVIGLPNSTAYPAHATTVRDLRSEIIDTLPIIGTSRYGNNQVASTPSITVAFTTEGAVATWVEEWLTGPSHPDISIRAYSDYYYGTSDFGNKEPNGSVADARFANGSNAVVLLPPDAQINSFGRVEFKQVHHIAQAAGASVGDSGGFAGWPADLTINQIKRGNRIFEGPRKPRRYSKPPESRTVAKTSSEPPQTSNRKAGLHRIIFKK